MSSSEFRRNPPFRAALLGALTLLALSDVRREALAQSIISDLNETTTADAASRLYVQNFDAPPLCPAVGTLHAVLASLCPSSGTVVGSCSVGMACSVMKAADCAAKNGVWLGTSCVDPNCAVSAFAGHNTLPFQMAYGLTDGTGVWQYAAAMTLESWSVTNSSGQSIATGTTASPLGYPIVVNGKLLVPPFTVAMSPSSAIVDGQTYKVAVKAKDKYGRSCSAVSNLTGHTPGLAAPPSRLTGSSSSNGVALSWTAPDPRYYVVSRYNIYRSDGSRWIGVAGVTPTSYTIPASAFVGVAGNVSFGVTSVNAAGVGPLSEVVQVSVAFPPAVPTGLTANVGTASTATAGFADLTWNASSGATSYSVRVSTTSGGPYTASQTVSATKATIPGLTIGQTYYFVIVATNSAGSSAPTASVTLLAKKYLP